MRLLLTTLVACSLLCGCTVEFRHSLTTSTASIDPPVTIVIPEDPGEPQTWADIPVSWRQHNYGYSCMHAAMETLLRWQDQRSLAEWWRQNHGGPETITGIAKKCEQVGLDYACPDQLGDEEFLLWASRTRRGAVIPFSARHAMTFCGIDRGLAVLIDPNNPETNLYVEWPQFIQEWRSRGGNAISVVYQPPPPTPRRVRRVQTK